MKNPLKADAKSRLMLIAETAADLMTSNPVSINEDDTVKEAVAFLTDKGISAAPVIDDAGRPIGVLSRSDILVHDREKVDYLTAVPEFYENTELKPRPDGNLRKGFQVENVDRTRVRDIMTPVVFSVTPGTAVRLVVEEMLSLKVHRLFVVDRDGVLVGVISALDILRHLSAEERWTPTPAPAKAVAGC